MSWGPNDATLVSAGSDGALFCWDWEAQKRIGESVTKGVSYASCFMAQVRLNGRIKNACTRCLQSSEVRRQEHVLKCFSRSMEGPFLGP